MRRAPLLQGTLRLRFFVFFPGWRHRGGSCAAIVTPLACRLGGERIRNLDLLAKLAQLLGSSGVPSGLKRLSDSPGRSVHRWGINLAHPAGKKVRASAGLEKPKSASKTLLRAQNFFWNFGLQEVWEV